MKKTILITTIILLGLSNNKNRKINKKNNIVQHRHFPQFNYEPGISLDEAYNIKKPEISKAYYSELDTKPHFYKIKSDTEFNFYCGILVPLNCPRVEVYFDVYNSNNTIYYKSAPLSALQKGKSLDASFGSGTVVAEKLELSEAAGVKAFDAVDVKASEVKASDATVVDKLDDSWNIIPQNKNSYRLLEENKDTVPNGKWKKWYEKYGKGYYWSGPELGKDYKSTIKFPKGNYIIKVYNNNNQGNYCLAVGDKEKYLNFLLNKKKIYKTVDKINSEWAN